MSARAIAGGNFGAFAGPVTTGPSKGSLSMVCQLKLCPSDRTCHASNSLFLWRPFVNGPRPPRGGEGARYTDPRARLVVSSGLKGLAAKLRPYRLPDGLSCCGNPICPPFSAQAISETLGAWWVRPLAQVLLPNGVPIGYRPRPLIHVNEARRCARPGH